MGTQTGSDITGACSYLNHSPVPPRSLKVSEVEDMQSPLKLVQQGQSHPTPIQCRRQVLYALHHALTYQAMPSEDSSAHSADDDT